MTGYKIMLKQIKSIKLTNYKGKDLKVFSPIDGSLLATLKCDDKKSVDAKIKNAAFAFENWRDVPAPKRGELIRIFGEELRKNKAELGKLITIESGKILQEGLGEVQEMIDICDYAVGLSRQIGGYTIPSERPKHTMQENWLPLGVVGVISAFNFPAAVWAWNASLAIICGDSVVWKPSEKTPLTAIFCQQIFEAACKKFIKETGISAAKNISQLIIGDRKIGQQLVDDARIALVSATGSTAMGKNVGEQVAKRFGKSLLELGGNNAVIVTESADLNVVIPSILFGAVGTCGQRCTTTRRAFVHKKIFESFYTKLKNLYAQLDKKIGNPLEAKTLIGPLIDEDAFANMQTALENISAEAVEICGGERALKKQGADAFYVKPALVKLKKQSKTIYHETFAPILYVMPYENLADAIAMNNAVPQGLSSSIFTTDVREAEIFKQYSDCGIANVNIGTSGAEIGGAFGGEKETGGGRESGSDSWKAYMRRQTSTTYYGTNPPALAQGIKFE
jgi:aldehyde dehydrogenase (NAD+)